MPQKSKGPRGGGPCDLLQFFAPHSVLLAKLFPALSVRRVLSRRPIRKLSRARAPLRGSCARRGHEQKAPFFSGGNVENPRRRARRPCDRGRTLLFGQVRWFFVEHADVPANAMTTPTDSNGQRQEPMSQPAEAWPKWTALTRMPMRLPDQAMRPTSAPAAPAATIMGSRCSS